MSKLIDAAHPLYCIRAALQTFTAESRRQDFDRLDEEERGDVITDLIGDLGQLAAEYELEPTALMRHFMARYNNEVIEHDTVELVHPLPDLPEREPIRFTDKLAAKRGQQPGGRGA